jgi:hypothetical protein
MPQPIHHDQDDAAGEVILGVDTHKDLPRCSGDHPVGCAAEQRDVPGHRGRLPGIAGLGE